MRVHIVDGRRRKNHWYPVSLCRRRLAGLGLSVRMYDQIGPDVLDCDVLMLTSRRHDELFGTMTDPAARAASVAGIAAKTSKLVWFDLRDSTGTPQFEVLPYVSLYVRQCLLKDIKLYNQPFYGGRIFADYYHRHYGIVDHVNAKMDNQEEGFTPLDLTLAPRVVVGWDVAYDYRDPRLGLLGRIDKAVHKGLWLAADVPPPPPVGHAISPRRARHTDLAVMFSTGRYGRETVAFQRKLALEKVRGLPGAVFAGKVPRREFVARLCDAKIVLSCFGNGEICFREHEAWLTGAAVMMCDMGHMRVWPDRYRDGETYRAVDWDFANLAAVYEELRGDEARRLALAEAGQDMMRQMFSASGLDAFANRFAALAKGIDPDNSGT